MDLLLSDTVHTSMYIHSIASSGIDESVDLGAAKAIIFQVYIRLHHYYFWQTPRCISVCWVYRERF